MSQIPYKEINGPFPHCWKHERKSGLQAECVAVMMRAQNWKKQETMPEDPIDINDQIDDDEIISVQLIAEVNCRRTIIR